MRHLRSCICLALIIIGCYSYAQEKSVHKIDTLFYLLDTAKIPFRDRIIDIIPYPTSNSFNTYIIKTHCWIAKSDPVLMSVRNESGQILTENAVKVISFINLARLNNLLCKEEEKFKKNHQLYFIEHLPNGKYLKRKIILGSPQIAIE